MMKFASTLLLLWSFLWIDPAVGGSHESDNNKHAVASDEQEAERILQDFDLDLFVWQFAGVNVTAESSQTFCPVEWQNLIMCVIADCPAFLDVCPEVGSADGGGISDDITCQDIADDLCDEYAGGDCCMIDCLSEMQELVQCLLLEENGIDLQCTTEPNCAVAATNSPTQGGGGESDFDLGVFTFEAGGVTITAEEAQNACPQDWQETITCVISDCPNFLDVCPGSVTVYGSPTRSPTPSPSDGPEITCDMLENDICSALGAEETDLNECCLLDCAPQYQALTLCILENLAGLPLSCDVVDCAGAGGGTSESLGGGNNNNNTCPLSINAIDSVCDVFLASLAGTEGCECYNFCNGELVGCHGFGVLEPFSCTGVAVAGCKNPTSVTQSDGAESEASIGIGVGTSRVESFP